MAANRIPGNKVYRVHRYHRRSGGGGATVGTGAIAILKKQENPVRQWLNNLFQKPQVDSSAPSPQDSGDKEKEARERLRQLEEREARLRSLYLESQLFQPMVNRDE